MLKETEEHIRKMLEAKIRPLKERVPAWMLPMILKYKIRRERWNVDEAGAYR